MSAQPPPAPQGHDLRLVAPAVLTWTIAALAVGWTTTQRLLALACCALATLLIGWRALRRGRGAHRARWSRPLPTLMLCALLMAAALASITAAQRVRDAPALSDALAGGGVTEVALRLDGIARPLGANPQGGQRYILPATLQEITTANGPVRVAVPVMVLAGQGWGDLAPGAVVGTEARLRPAEAGERAVAWAFPGGLPQIRDPPAPWQELAQGFRVGLRTAVDGLAPHAAGLIPGVAIGDDSEVPPSLADAMRASSLGHLLAVSGAHVAVLLAVIQVLTGWAGVAIRVVASLGAVGALVLLVGPEASVIRAAVMGGVAMLGIALGRRSSAIPALATAVVLLVLLDPWIAREIGFILSVSATAGIVIWSRPWGLWWEARLGRAGWLAPAIAVPLAAQIACLPALLLVDSGIPTLGVPANALVAPVVPVLTVMALAATAVSPLAPGVAHALVWAAQPATWWIDRVATWSSSLPLARLPWPGPPGGVAIAVVIMGGAWCAGRNPRLRAGLARRMATLRRRMPALAIFVAVVVVVASAIPVTRPALVSVLGPGLGPGVPARWRVLACDVGQGTAMAVSTEPEGGGPRAVLVDTGSVDGQVVSCLRSAGVRTLDLLILTHADLDHVGGLEDVLASVDVERAVIAPTTDPRMQQVAAALAAAGVTTSIVDTRTEPLDAGSLEVTVLWPSPRAVSLATADEERAINDLSLTTWIAAPDLTVFANGDLGGFAQSMLARGLPGTWPPPDVLLVAHHGSRDQDSDLLARTAGLVSLVSVGADNDYGHPAPETIQSLRSAGSVVARTDECGPVAVLRRLGQLEATRC